MPSENCSCKNIKLQGGWLTCVCCSKCVCLYGAISTNPSFTLPKKRVEFHLHVVGGGEFICIRRASVRRRDMRGARWVNRCAAPGRPAGSGAPGPSGCCTGYMAPRTRSRVGCCRWHSASPPPPCWGQTDKGFNTFTQSALVSTNWEQLGVLVYKKTLKIKLGRKKKKNALFSM